MNRPSDDDYDERGAMRRMLASEVAREDQPPPAMVLSDQSGAWFRVWCGACMREISGWHKILKASALATADAHNREHARHSGFELPKPDSVLRAWLRGYEESGSAFGLTYDADPESPRSVAYDMGRNVRGG